MLQHFIKNFNHQLLLKGNILSHLDSSPGMNRWLAISPVTNRKSSVSPDIKKKLVLMEKKCKENNGWYCSHLTDGLRLKRCRKRGSTAHPEGWKQWRNCPISAEGSVIVLFKRISLYLHRDIWILSELSVHYQKHLPVL